jgi:hypothetical protein
MCAINVSGKLAPKVDSAQGKKTYKPLFTLLAHRPSTKLHLKKNVASDTIVR